jgi:branched-chain amino acid transport system substrate-binding protein
MKFGIELAFNAQNALGGIRGRTVSLDFRDDQYDPTLAEEAARDLTAAVTSSAPPRCPTTDDPSVSGPPPVSTRALERGPGAVLAFLGNVGTPTMVRTAPVSLETGTIFFGAFTGAQPILRDSSAGACSRYVFNIRASYANEASATLAYFFQQGVPDYKHLVSFDQDDSFGQAGYDGLKAAYVAIRGPFESGADPTNPIERVRYTRGDTSTLSTQVQNAAAYLAVLLAGDTTDHTVGILMTDTYGPATQFITGIRQWQFADDDQQKSLRKATRLTLYFSNLSFVGSNALAQRLKNAGTVKGPSGPIPYTANVLVSQVVPNYESDQSDLVQDYLGAVSKVQGSPTFTSLEGYLDARVFIAGLLAHAGPFSPDSLVTTFETLPDLSLGVGATSGFSPGNHNYSKSVWGTAIGTDGGFQNIYFWSENSPIQFFE